MDLGRDNILDKQLVKELEESYLNYSMSVIMSRALPDARDGLKPVHRRILFSMSEMSAMWNRPYKKSARVVGEVLVKTPSSLRKFSILQPFLVALLKMKVKPKKTSIFQTFLLCCIDDLLQNCRFFFDVNNEGKEFV